jgi:hypothetical protein
MALLALSALLYRLEQREPSPPDQAASGSVGRAPEAVASISLPPLPSLTELREPVANLVLRLNRFGTRRENPVLASMYRHLAYWPAYLALSWMLVAPLDADGSLDRTIAALLVKARAQAARLAARLREPTLDAATVAAVRSAAESFAGDVIAKMVVICALLRTATQPEVGSDAIL